MDEEWVYYHRGNVKVTRSALSVGSKSYAIPSITKVAVRRVPADKAMPYMMLLLGLLIALWGVATKSPLKIAFGVLSLLVGGRYLLHSEDRYEFYVTTYRGVEKALENVGKPRQMGDVEKAVKDAVFDVQGKKIW